MEDKTKSSYGTQTKKLVRTYIKSIFGWICLLREYEFKFLPTHIPQPINTILYSYFVNGES